MAADFPFAEDIKYVDALGVEHMLHARGRTFEEFCKNSRDLAGFIAGRGGDIVPPAAAAAPKRSRAGDPPRNVTPIKADDPAPVCPEHAASKPSKFGGYFCPATLADGEFCKWKSQTRRSA